MDERILDIPNEHTYHEIDQAVRDFEAHTQQSSKLGGEGLLGIAASEQEKVRMSLQMDLLALRNEDKMPLKIDDDERREILVRALQNRLSMLYKQLPNSVGRVHTATAQCAKLVRDVLRQLKASLKPSTELEEDVVDRLPG